MKKCWFSHVVALSAIYSVLTQSEQLLLHELHLDDLSDGQDVTRLVASLYDEPQADSHLAQIQPPFSQDDALLTRSV